MKTNDICYLLSGRGGRIRLGSVACGADDRHRLALSSRRSSSGRERPCFPMTLPQENNTMARISGKEETVQFMVWIQKLILYPMAVHFAGIFSRGRNQY